MLIGFNIKYSDVDAKATGVKNVLSFQITLAMVQIRVVVDMEGKTSMCYYLIEPAVELKSIS